MLRRLIITLSLLAGIATAIGLFVAAVALAPEVAHPGPSASGLPIGSLAPQSSSPGAAGSPGVNASAGAVSSPGPSPAGSPASAGSPSPSDPLAAQFRIGQPAPALVVRKLGGGKIDLSTLRGTAVWVNFMGTYCLPCRDEFPLMNGFAARYASAGLTIVAVDVDEDDATVAAFAKSLKTIFPIGLDPGGAAERTWGAIVLPVHYWIDAQGIVRGGAFGGIGPDVMAAQLQKILPGVTVTP